MYKYSSNAEFIVTIKSVYHEFHTKLLLDKSYDKTKMTTYCLKFYTFQFGWKIIMSMNGQRLFESF
jgi:hypothetical protein